MSTTTRVRAAWLAVLMLFVCGCVPTSGAGPEAGPTHPEPARTIIIETDVSP